MIGAYLVDVRVVRVGQKPGARRVPRVAVDTRRRPFMQHIVGQHDLAVDEGLQRVAGARAVGDVESRHATMVDGHAHDSTRQAEAGRDDDCDTA